MPTAKFSIFLTDKPMGLNENVMGKLKFKNHLQLNNITLKINYSFTSIYQKKEVLQFCELLRNIFMGCFESTVGPLLSDLSGGG